MKHKYFFLLLSSFILILASCDKDEVTLQARSYDFLMQNSKYHYSLDSIYSDKLIRQNAIINKYANDSVLLLASNYYKKVDSLYVSINDSIRPTENLKIVADDQVLSDTFINQWISQRLRLYNRVRDKIGISEDIFFEYILPYRINNGFILENWQDSITCLSIDTIDSTKVTDIWDYFIDINSSISRKLHHKPFAKNVASARQLVCTKNLINLKNANCFNKCLINQLVYSSYGVPITIDYAPCYANNWVSHSWNVLLSDSLAIPIDSHDGNILFYQYSNREYIYGVKLHFPKIYRRQFSANPAIVDIHQNMKEVPYHFSNPCISDVSDKYFETSFLEIPIKSKVESDYLFLCVLMHDNWECIDFAKVNDNQVNFNKIGRGILYCVCKYENKRAIPVQNPFYLTSDGDLQFFDSTSTLDSVKITTLYDQLPYDNPDSKYFANLKIYATDKIYAVHSKKIHELNDHERFDVQTIDLKHLPPTKYLYLKSHNLGFKLNELMLYDKNNNKICLNDHINWELTILNSHDSCELKKLVDEDINTTCFIESSHTIVFDLPLWTKLSHLKYKIPNRQKIDLKIKLQLYQYVDHKWVEITKRNINVFYNVPQNNLFMLKYFDTKKQKWENSRPFILVEKQQVFL